MSQQKHFGWVGSFTVAFAVLTLVGSVGACSQKEESPPSTTEPETQNVPDEKEPVVDETPDSGVPDAGPDVTCGATTCTGGQKCCLAGTDGGTQFECRDSCPISGDVKCDSPDDCTGTANVLCCFSGELSSAGSFCVPKNVTSSCKNTCALVQPSACSGRAQGALCAKKSDCATNGTFTHCCPFRTGNSTSSFITACTDVVPAEGNCLP